MLYQRKDSLNAGSLSEARESRINFRRVGTTRQKRTLAIWSASLLSLDVFFIIWLLNPRHLVSSGTVLNTSLSILGFICVLVIELTRIYQGVSIAFFAHKAVDPIPQIPEKGKRVAILTTIVPSKEPVQIVRRTLQAMKQIYYAGQVDVWILDEGNSPEVKVLAAELGVKHFSRKGIETYNQPSGTYRAKSKSGNHNAWRAEYEHEYDYVAQMDPDHTPFSNFLERTLGYFNDPDTGFVVAPQVYGNQDQGWLTKAAAAQSYIFHAILQRGANSFGSPLLIGTNHVYRTVAWHQIGGYQDCVIEDHLTSMKLHGTINQATGKHWKGVYAPDIISIGEGPSSWTDYFNQQKRWAYGIWEIILHHSRKLDRHLSAGQSFYYAALQFFYPSVALVWILGAIVSMLYFFDGIKSLAVSDVDWFIVWGLSLGLQIGLFMWLNIFNLTYAERKYKGLDALLLTLMTAPIYVSAGLTALARISLTYAVTAKGELRSFDTIATFKSHLYWAILGSLFIVFGIALHHTMATQIFWDSFTLAISGLPAVFILLTQYLSGHFVFGSMKYIAKEIVHQYVPKARKKTSAAAILH